MRLMYKQAATEWEETLPLGNGRLGAMLWGNPKSDVIGLNDDHLWSGYPKTTQQTDTWKSFELIKEYLLKGKRSEAQAVIQNTFLSNFTESYLPLGKLYFTFGMKGCVSHYQRALDLETGLAEVNYQMVLNGSDTILNIKREYFTSYPDQALYGRMTSSEANTLSVNIGFESQIYYQISQENPAGITIQIKAPERVEPPYISGEEPIYYGSRGLEFSYQLQISATDGQVDYQADQLIIRNATYIDWLFRKSSNQARRDYQTAKSAHIKDYQQLFKRVELDLGPQLQMPTDERLRRLKTGHEDPGLISLYFQYGRYLLIASSRPGSLPANLQGIWSWELRSPWSSNWTTNINLSMNYWGADSCNLSECFTPYAEFVKQLTQAGKLTAKHYYNALGSVSHHNSDRWYHTSPVGKAHGAQQAQEGAEVYALWPMALPWMSADLYRHYEYTNDRTYLRETVFPILSEVVAFILNYVTLSEGVYHTIPSTSPENSFIDEAGQVRSVDKSTAMDIELIQEAFAHYQSSCELLGIEGEHLDNIQSIQANLAKVQIGSKGQVLEWQTEYEEPEPGHRHFSHLYGAYPSEVFNQTYLDATRHSLAIRMQHGSGHTGWSNAWLVSLYAVLNEAELAYEHIIHGIANASYPNLWSSHPPFQIDGNFGMMAGIANLLVQDRYGQIKLLPALPKALQSGYVKGLKIKGNRTVEIRWENGEIVTSRISLD